MAKVRVYDGNANDEGSAPDDPSSPYLPGEAMVVLGNIADPPLTRSGFTFVGWNTAADGGGIVYRTGESDLVTQSLTLYAQWSGDVSYDGNDNTGGDAPGPSPYLAGKTVTVVGQGTLAKEGYSFSGWNARADGEGDSYAVDEMFPMAGSLTLYAVWTPDLYSVTYDGNGHTGGSVPQDGGQYEPDSVVTILGNTGSLVKTGYRFSGWNTAANGSGTSLLPDALFLIGADTTLYAKWTPSDSGGSGASSGSTGSGTSITPAPVAQAPAAPAPPALQAPNHSWSNPLDDLFRLLGSGALVDNGDGLTTAVLPTQSIFTFYGALEQAPLPLLLGQSITTPLGLGSFSLGGLIQPQSPSAVASQAVGGPLELLGGSGLGGFSAGGVSVPGSNATGISASSTSAGLGVASGGSVVFFGTDALPGSLGTVIVSGPSVSGPLSSVQPIVTAADNFVPSLRTLLGALLDPGGTRASAKAASVQAASTESPQPAGSFAVAADGTYRGALQAPANAVPGRMFVQFATYAPDGRVQAMVLPLTVRPAAATLRARIVFAYEGSTLTVAAKKQLRHLASRVPLGTTMTSLAVGLRNGARHSASDTLAMSRAKAVAKYLAHMGVTTTYGSARPDQPLPNTASSRRVDAVIQYQASSDEAESDARCRQCSVGSGA